MASFRKGVMGKGVFLECRVCSDPPRSRNKMGLDGQGIFGGKDKEWELELEGVRAVRPCARLASGEGAAGKGESQMAAQFQESFDQATRVSLRQSHHRRSSYVWQEWFSLSTSTMQGHWLGPGGKPGHRMDTLVAISPYAPRSRRSEHACSWPLHAVW